MSELPGIYLQEHQNKRKNTGAGKLTLGENLHSVQISEQKLSAEAVGMLSTSCKALSTWQNSFLVLFSQETEC